MPRPVYRYVGNVDRSPVTYDEAAAHLRVDSSASADFDERIYVQGLLNAATEYVENITGEATTAGDFELIAGSWQCLGLSFDRLSIDRFPLLSVTSVEYMGSDDKTYTAVPTEDFDAIPSMGGIIIPSPPSTNVDRPDAIRIRFRAGYESPFQVSAVTKHAIKMLAAHWYENRLPVAAVYLSQIPHTLRDIIIQKRASGFFS